MKKAVSLILIVAMALSLAACGARQPSGETEAATGAADPTSAAVNAAESVADAAADSGKKILTVYFSAANTSDVDVVSSATPYFDGVASTQYLAEYIHGKVGGDLLKVTPVEDYPESYNDTADAAKGERDADARPAMQPLAVNPEDYDVIFIGYPMWWYTLPMILYTFFDTYDFSGKTIIPFNTHAGSGDGGTYEEIRDFEPDATVLEGIAVSGSRADRADSDLDAWLAGLDF